jgi:hypothetical protein
MRRVRQRDWTQARHIADGGMCRAAVLLKRVIWETSVYFVVSAPHQRDLGIKL